MTQQNIDLYIQNFNKHACEKNNWLQQKNSIGVTFSNNFVLKIHNKLLMSYYTLLQKETLLMSIY